MNIDTRLGTIRSVAGNGTPGCSGDGGPALVASLNEPKNLCLDGHGNLLIADSENHVIRKVDRVSGTIQTVAGGSAMPSTGRAAEQTAVSADDLFSEGTVTADKAFAQQTDLSGTVRYVVNGIGGQTVCRRRRAGNSRTVEFSDGDCRRPRRSFVYCRYHESPRSSRGRQNRSDSHARRRGTAAIQR